MVCSIDDFALADSTFANGFALGGTTISVQRTFDEVTVLHTLNPVLFDRGLRKTTVEFTVARVHDTIAAAEIYIGAHDALVPSSGDVVFGMDDGGTATLEKAALVNHELVTQIGKTTFHTYRIIGGVFDVTGGGGGGGGKHILTEDGDFITTEGGDKLVTE